MVEWFKAAVLKTAEGQLSEGSNPSFSAIFFAKKWRTKPQGFSSLSRQAQLHIFTRRQPLFTQKTKFFLHIFTKTEKPCLLVPP